MIGGASVGLVLDRASERGTVVIAAQSPAQHSSRLAELDRWWCHCLAVSDQLTVACPRDVWLGVGSARAAGQTRRLPRRQHGP